MVSARCWQDDGEALDLGASLILAEWCDYRDGVPAVTPLPGQQIEQKPPVVCSLASQSARSFPGFPPPGSIPGSMTLRGVDEVVAGCLTSRGFRTLLRGAEGKNLGDSTPSLESRGGRAVGGPPRQPNGAEMAGHTLVIVVTLKRTSSRSQHSQHGVAQPGGTGCLSGQGRGRSERGRTTAQGQSSLAWNRARLINTGNALGVGSGPRWSAGGQPWSTKSSGDQLWSESALCPLGPVSRTEHQLQRPGTEGRGPGLQHLDEPPRCRLEKTYHQVYPGQLVTILDSR
ncbi:hypothetical protein EGW08_001338 [Elysia chlorotica]|uniref:Uncharacterized protein n=1 Tax=Elysia chlorotica TaxID=188477 RepID=A0A433UAV9_ELYCH|nr:hypothetical protein EGW08_001338 [Elysia chlorotica]